MKLTSPIRGLVAATFTPFHADGDVNCEQIPILVDALARQGIAGLYVLGSTGEGLSLAPDERCDVAAAFVAASSGRLPVIVQVGSESLRQSKRLAAHAQEIGASAVSAVSPVYFKPDSAEALVASMAEVAAGAPQLPFYYYHIPSMTGVAISITDILSLAVERIPTFRGVKFTSPNVYEYQACLELAGDQYDVFWGLDEMLLGALSAGGRAAVGSTYNFAAPIYQRLLTAFADGDLQVARREQSHSQAIVRTFARYGARAAQKAIMKMVGCDCGPPRLPIQPLSDANYQSLRNDLASLGFFDWIETASQESGRHAAHVS